MTISDYIKANGLTHEKFAELIGVSRSYVTLLISGSRSVSPKLAQKIETQTNGQLNAVSLVFPLEGAQ